MILEFTLLHHSKSLLLKGTGKKPSRAGSRQQGRSPQSGTTVCWCQPEIRTASLTTRQERTESCGQWFYHGSIEKSLACAPSSVKIVDLLFIFIPSSDLLFLYEFSLRR
jgi:hypothetical protein